MPTRYDSEDDAQDSGRGDREISLGTGTVLGIFLALALVCSLFFGLGYSMGRKSSPATPVASSASPSVFARGGEGEKPSPGTATRHVDSTAGTTSQPDQQIVQPIDETPSREAPAERPFGVKPAAHDRSSTPRSLNPNSNAASEMPSPPSATELASQSFVQIAAVSRREDADLLLSALKKRGYTGLVRQQTQDKLLHIQVGPFPTKKDAEAMRQRLITDGYNPIIK